MNYLNIDTLKQIPAKEFLNTQPYPWRNLNGCLTGEGLKELLATLPDVSMFEKSFSMEREHGQKPHDRFELRYSDQLVLAPPWQAFIKELSGSLYSQEVKRLFSVKDFNIRFQWHYSYAGCSVSPHCDSKSKIGSHIFYLNTPDNWREEWGGQTLILDDEGRMDCDSAPDIETFPKKISVKTLGNYSLLFARTDHSWHCVQALNSPPDVLRKIFTVVLEKKVSFKERLAYKLKSFFINV